VSYEGLFCDKDWGCKNLFTLKGEVGKKRASMGRTDIP